MTDTKSRGVYRWASFIILPLNLLLAFAAVPARTRAATTPFEQGRAVGYPIGFALGQALIFPLLVAFLVSLIPRFRTARTRYALFFFCSLYVTLMLLAKLASHAVR